MATGFSGFSFICMIVLSCLPIEASAKTYKCMTEGGVYSFQDAPCEADFHDKSFDPVPGLSPRYRPDRSITTRSPTGQWTKADSEQAADSTVKNMLLFIAVIIYLSLSAFQDGGPACETGRSGNGFSSRR